MIWECYLRVKEQDKNPPLTVFFSAASAIAESQWYYVPGGAVLRLWAHVPATEWKMEKKKILKSHLGLPRPRHSFGAREACPVPPVPSVNSF